MNALTPLVRAKGCQVCQHYLGTMYWQAVLGQAGGLFLT
jgi:hypothetical protein